MNRDHQNYWDDIDDFLDNRQTTDQRQAFSDRLQTDPTLAADVNLQQSLHRGIAYSGHTQSSLKDRLRKIHQETQSTSAKTINLAQRNRSWKRWLSVAAVLAIAVLSVVFWTQQSGVDSQELYAANYSPYELDLMQRGEELPVLLAQLDASYGAGDFKTAAPLLEQALAIDPNNASLSLAQAITKWENGQTESAQQQLETLFNHPLLKDQAYWYAALFALQNGQNSSVKTYLSAINNDSGKRYQQAQKLLKQLK